MEHKWTFVALNEWHRNAIKLHTTSHHAHAPQHGTVFDIDSSMSFDGAFSVHRRKPYNLAMQQAIRRCAQGTKHTLRYFHNT